MIQTSAIQLFRLQLLLPLLFEVLLSEYEKKGGRRNRGGEEKLRPFAPPYIKESQELKTGGVGKVSSDTR